MKDVFLQDSIIRFKLTFRDKIYRMHVPTMAEMMAKGTPEQIDLVTKAFMPMKKLDLATIEKAFKGEK